MKKIAIIGHFGGKKEFLDGQTIKTKILYNELKNATDWKIQKIDTYLKQKNPICLFLTTLYALLLRKDVIVLLSGNGMKSFFPMLSFFARHWKVRIYHDVIGGKLDNYVKAYKKFGKYLLSFKVNWVETKELEKDLLNVGISNCETIPNFKRLNVVDNDELLVKYEKPFAFCMFSRVMREKGVEIAIDAIEKINKDANETVCTLDIYGAVDERYLDAFNKVLNSASEAIRYCGVVPYSESVDTIKGYYGLAFPTFWDGEGFPGTIIDAYSAGVPVIASDWNSNAEIVKNLKTGILYPNESDKTFLDAIKHYISMSSDEIYKLKLNCVEAAADYQPDKHIKKIIETMTQ